MRQYDHKKIEKKWQKEWEEKEAHKTEDKSEKPKYYCLVEFPYPSGDGLHTGHVRSYTAMDIVARKRRAEGYNVLYPVGWDAFGLPTENYAIKTKTAPEVVTKENTDTFRRQLKSMGLSFDWSREINTTDPKYYKWTQWIFLQFFKKGLAYKKKTPINWCLDCKIGLANEEVVGGLCDRCEGKTEKREKEQWMLAITKYADRLDKDLDSVDYLPRIKIQQRNWIGRSEGAEIEFSLKNISGQEDGKHKVTVFTTRPDTLFGATFLAVSPEVAQKWLEVGWPASEEVKKFINKEIKARAKKGFEVETEKRGIDAGIKSINPASKEEIPVWIVNYVLGDVGTGAIMAVPAHDQRDLEFARKYNLPVKEVVMPSVVDHVNPPESGKSTKTRHNVHAIVYSPERKAYLTLTSKKFHWNTVIIGGVEDGEDPVEAARREVMEETGYTDLQFKRPLGGPVKAAYFARHKDENREAVTQAFYFELKSEKSVSRPEEEIEANELIWTKPEDFVPGKMVNSELPYWLERISAKEEKAFIGEGVLINSGKFNDSDSEKAKREITKFVGGKWTTTYKLRDWVFSRQRYWGEPIPIIICGKCGFVPVPEEELPLELPRVKNYQPTDTGESPLAKIEDWVNTKCPKCYGPAKRETDTMPNWAGSSWYYFRYIDPHNDKVFADRKKLDRFMPVDWYNGGMEHTTLHLLYSRFWHKFLYDEGLVADSEPYKKRTSHGMILAEGGEKMSKSKGNVVSPDSIVETYGADTLRLYEMFMGPFDQAVAWSTDSIIGPRRFLERVWRLTERVSDSAEQERFAVAENQVIKKIGEDIESMSFNTAVSALMIFLNELEKEEAVVKQSFEVFIRLLAPFAPHISEEMWSNLGHKNSIHSEPWPRYDQSKLKKDTMIITLQINGRVRGSFEISSSATEEEVKKAALGGEVAQKWLKDSPPNRVIYAKGRLVNITT